MKYVLVIIFVVGSGIIGKIIQEKYNKKVKVYKSLINFANFLKLNIFNLHEDILLIIDKFIESDIKEFKDDFEKIKVMILNNEVTEKNLIKLKLFNDINKSELNDINNFLSILGKNNLDSQISLIENYEHIFEVRLTEAKTEEMQKGNISFKISVCAGVMLSILII